MNDDILKLVNQRQLVSVMNMTKWTELCNSFGSQDAISPNVRYKFISGDKIFGFSKVWWSQLLIECQAIEWIDFELVEREYRGKLVSDKETDISEYIKSVFQAHSVPYSIEGKCFRVWGYISAKNNPVFV